MNLDKFKKIYGYSEHSLDDLAETAVRLLPKNHSLHDLAAKYLKGKESFEAELHLAGVRIPDALREKLHEQGQIP